MGLLEIDSGRRILDANRLVSEWTGLAVPTLVGREFDELFRSPEGNDSTDAAYLPCVAEFMLPPCGGLPVFVAEGPLLDDGRRYVTLLDARAQHESTERLQRRHALVER